MKRAFFILFLFIFYSPGIAQTTWLSLDGKTEESLPEMVFEDNGAGGLTIDYTFHGVLV